MKKTNKILCATDLSKSSRDFLFQVFKLCLRFDACLWIFHAVPPPLGSVSSRIEFERGGEKEEKIEKARKKIKQIMHGFKGEWEFFITYGDPVLEIEKAVKKINPDMVMAASHGLSGLQQFLLGSVIGRMARAVQQPFLVIPPDKTGHLKFEKIIIACSLLQSDVCLKEYGQALSEKFDSKIFLVHVMESPRNEAILENSLAPYDKVQSLLEEKLSLQLEKLMPGKTKILKGVPGEELFLYAKIHKADLIIAGKDDYPGRIIPSTTATLLYHLPCAVLVIPVKADAFLRNESDGGK